MTKLEKLKKEIQRLRPEIGTKFCSAHQKPDTNCRICFRDINIEDVLAVLGEIYGNFDVFYNKENKTCSIYSGNNKNIKWLLGKPLDDQSEETINFLHSLIVK